MLVRNPREFFAGRLRGRRAMSDHGAGPGRESRSTTPGCGPRTPAGSGATPGCPTRWSPCSARASWPARTPRRWPRWAASRVSYRELWDRAARVAGGLREQGIEPGDRVAIRLPNSIDWMLAFFGGLMAGAVVVPVNTRLAPSRSAT